MPLCDIYIHQNEEEITDYIYKYIYIYIYIYIDRSD